MSRGLLRVVLAVVLPVALLASCGGGGSPGRPTAPSTNPYAPGGGASPSAMPSKSPGGYEYGY